MSNKDKTDTANKHAYLVMAHQRPDLLKKLLESLDDKRNDIYLHIDKKANEDMNPSLFSTNESSLFLTKRIRVNWAGYSQIECTLNMLEDAVRRGGYSRYHLITGGSFPLRNQDYIHSFFDNHPTEEFMDIDNPVPERVMYRYLFNESFRAQGRKARLMWQIREKYLDIQRRRGVDRFKKFNMEHKKGLAYWSITNGMASHTVANRKLIRDMMKYSECGDEVFMQTIAYNSEYRDRLFDKDGKTHGSLRLTTWPLEDNGIKRQNHNFTMEDKEFILNDKNSLFALKFEGSDGLKLIEEIKKGLKH